MKNKTLIMTIISCIFCIALIVVSGYAVSFLKMDVRGEINFVSYDKLVYVEQIKINNYVENIGDNYQAKSKVLEQWNGVYLRNSSAVSSIDLSNLYVLQDEYLTIEISLMSLYSKSDLFVKCDYNNVAGVNISYTTTLLTKNASQSVSAGTTREFVLTITNTNSGVLNLSDISIDISFEEPYVIDNTGVITNRNETKYTGVLYTIDTENHTATAKANTAVSSSELEIVSFVVKDGTIYNVTSIPDGTYSTSAFLSNTMTNITLPNSLKYIGVYAFYKCASLKSIQIPSSVETIANYAFYNCTTLENLGLTNGLKTLGQNAFYYCKALKSVKLPNSLTNIPAAAFSMCSSLTSVYIGNGVETIKCDANNGTPFRGANSLESVVVSSGNATFHSQNNCIIKTATKELVMGCALSVIPSDGSVTTIADSSFAYVSGLKSIIIPSQIKQIASSAFRDCTALTSITFNEGLLSIGSMGFYNCGFSSISLPLSLTTLESQCFDNSNLNSIYIPKNVSSIGSFLLNRCSNLYQIEVDANNQTYDSGNGSNCIIEKATRKLIAGCVDTVLSDSSNVKIIGSNAFGDGQSPMEITIPATVEEIEDHAFEVMGGLIVTVEATTPPRIGMSPFGMYPTIYVPSSAYDLYKTEWLDYQNCIYTR